jgi:tetratricopeptide (TPR) repeat protein
MANKYMDSARNISKPDSYDYLYLSGLQNLKNHRLEEAKSYLNQVLSKFTLTPQKQAVNYHNLSYIFAALGDSEKAAEYMVYAALADLQVATKETAAVYTLARLLYEQGDVNNAYIFIEQAMDDALYYGARQRKVEIGSLLPVIGETVEYVRGATQIVVHVCNGCYHLVHNGVCFCNCHCATIEKAKGR